MQIRPIGERVLIKQNERKEKTAGGIYIPESAKEDRKEGVVVAVGKHNDGKELPLKKGDKVIYGGYSSDDIEMGGEKYIFIDYKDVLGIIE